MKNSFLILGFLISLLISCPPPTPEPGPDEGGSGSGNETAKEFTVSFDANGGTGTIAPMKVKAGTEITLPDGTAFTRKYYTFNYWTISGLDFYEEGSKYTVKADTVFSAAWSLNSVLITYDSNDDTVFDTEQWVYAGSDLILPGKNQFDSSPAGKSFYGWTTDAAATEADILAPGSAFRVEETDLTFYAYWGTEPVKEYKVTFFGTEMEAIAFNRYTEEIRLPLYTGEPGIICKGWDIDAAAANVVYEDGGIIPKEKLTDNIVLYPILEDVRVTLTWEKNGNVVSPDDSTAFPDRVAPGDFHFMAYAVTKDSGDGKVWILDSVTAKTVSGKTVPTRKEMMDGLAEIWYISVPAEATVITLNWKEKTDVVITSLNVAENYDYSGEESSIDFQFVYKADFDPAKGNLKITKDGQEVEILSYHYEFYTAEEKIAFCGLSPAAGAGQYQLQIIVNGNVLKEASFYVTFTEGGDPTTPQTHTVTFNAGGGNGTVDPMTAETGSAITLPSADGLSRQYYTFTAWETGGKQYNPDDEFTVSADTVFTAVWTRNTITVTYEAGNASVTPATHTETVDAGGIFRLPENPFNNSPDGQILYGWALTQTPQESDILEPNTEYTAGEADIIFYAVWVTFTEGDDPTTPQTHTVTFNAGGGTGTVDPMTAETGSAITLPSADGLSRQYYTFTAWKTGGKQYNPGDEFTVSAETVFTAVWTRNTITVTYEANNASVMPATHKETVDAGGMFYLSGNPFVNSPAGQIFYGWALTQTPQDFDILKPNAYSFAKEDDITFYAVWKSSSEVVSLTWNKNGGEILNPNLGEADLFPTTLTSDTTFTFPAYAVTKKPASGANPFLLTGLTVTTADNEPVSVSKQTNGESGLSEWSFTTGSKNLNITLNWEEVIYPSVTISQILPTYNPGAMNVAMTYLSCNFNPYPEMLSLYEYKSEKDEFELVSADYRFYAPVKGEYVFEIKWSETITGRKHYYKVNATTGSRSNEKNFFLEPPKIALTYIKNGAEVPPAYEDYTFPETAYYEETLQIFQLMFYKNDGTDTPWILSGIRVTETDNPSVTLTVTSGSSSEPTERTESAATRRQACGNANRW